ncbi:MAG: hypothetical protein H6865_01800 [Rhodospirillales bacterium]|nr:hypothetical protein [Alphaproteobacteria bacterium]MCB9986353.1 hypothetical protein [Rhodospirillales bacterium]USO07098.1 MAG: hypothetical protein H6866_06585 [Rhodospirillales bacterium]
MRRPLAPETHPDRQVFTTPFERLVQSFAQSAAMPPYCVHCTEPLFVFENVRDVALALGLGAAPRQRRDLYPRAALSDTQGRPQHPAEFLQWGWLRQGDRQILFELGDSSFLASFVFLKPEPGDPACSWQLDQLVIDTGEEEIYHIPCDEPDLAMHARQVLDAVGGAVRHLNVDAWPVAQDTLHTALRTVLRQLDDISEAQAREHAAYMTDRAQQRTSSGIVSKTP